LFGLISRLSPNLKRELWRIWYQYLANNREAEWAFMNYGFVDLDPHAKPLALSPSDEKDRLCIQLYHHVAGAVDLRGLDVLEVGCGRGGGCSYIWGYLGPRSVVGVDLSQKAIELCRRHHAAAGLRFSQGDAEALPFADRTFDVVVNVESSHCYGSMERFLSEVCRVLRPHGYFLLADLRGRDRVVPLREQLRSSGLALLKEEAISLNVLAALDLGNERKLGLIREKVPRLLRRSFHHFAGIKGTKIYESLRDGGSEYLSYILRKNAR
jgi:SAM-dependent methyltransferase